MGRYRIPLSYRKWQIFNTGWKAYRGRDPELQGAHTLGLNNRSLSICLIGDHDRVPPSTAQLDTLTQWLINAAKEHQLPSSRIIGHNESPRAKKSCPGKFVNMDLLRRVIAPNL